MLPGGFLQALKDQEVIDVRHLVGQLPDGELAVAVQVVEHGLLLPEVVVLLLQQLLRVQDLRLCQHLDVSLVLILLQEPKAALVFLRFLGVGIRVLGVFEVVLLLFVVGVRLSGLYLGIECYVDATGFIINLPYCFIVLLVVISFVLLNREPKADSLNSHSSLINGRVGPVLFVSVEGRPLLLSLEVLVLLHWSHSPGVLLLRLAGDLVLPFELAGLHLVALHVDFRSLVDSA
mmetsp:Transcript_1923/g.2739  ORF Transcript_1923/g.2739 Transcript_1923/m.2739 type:complete len:233 (+) Transcript_1923:1037-1735(+)